MAGTTLTYNGITIENCLTKVLEQTPVREATGSDIQYWKIRIKVEGVLSLSNTITHGLKMTTSSLAQNIHDAFEALNHDRKSLVYAVDGAAVLSINPITSNNKNLAGKDVNHGPKPQGLSVLSIYGTKSAKIAYDIETYVVACPSVQNNTGILSHKYKSFDRISGDNHRTTRTYQGTVILASTTMNAQAYRSVCVPPLQGNFKRKQLTFNVSLDGKTIEYEILDEQQFVGVPSPATDWQVRHSEKTDRGIKCISSISVQLTGPPSVDKSALVALAASIAEDRLRDETGSLGRVLNVDLIDHMHDSIVEFNVTTERVGKGKVSVAALQARGFGSSLQGRIDGYDQRVTVPPEIYGDASTPIGLIVAQLQDPCTDVGKRIPKGLDTSVSNEKTKTGNAGQTKIKQGYIPSPSRQYDDEHQNKGHYTSYEIGNQYEIDQHKVMFPVAESAGSSASSSASKSSAVFVQMGPATAKRTVVILAERVGLPPRIMEPQESFQDSNGITHHLLHRVENWATPEVQVDGEQKIYTCTAKYYYGMDRAPTTKEKLRVGSLPWDKTKLSENAIPLSQVYDKGIG